MIDDLAEKAMENEDIVEKKIALLLNDLKVAVWMYNSNKLEYPMADKPTSADLVMPGIVKVVSELLSLKGIEIPSSNIWEDDVSDCKATQ